MDDDCEDQALCPTKTCVKYECQKGFVSGRAVYAPLVRRGKFWCCSNCGSSYGENPHPDLTRTCATPEQWASVP